jgi:alpha-galactosidase
VIVSTRIENRGVAPITEIGLLEPLRIVFRNPVTAWRHIFANGGTTESFYPPTAYRTLERSGGGEVLKIESHPEGRSSNLYLPFLVSLASRAEDSEGFFCGMDWSGAWQMTVWRDDETRTGFCVGVQVRGVTLEPGEKLPLPDVHLGFFRGGPEAGTNALRRHLYERVCPNYQGKPTLPRVSYDHWFGIGNSLNMDRMKAQAVRAAQLGVEVFVVDAAWFPGDFPHGVGNWDQVDRAKFPDGLEPLADYVRSLGMDFGLWFEVERAVEPQKCVNGAWIERVS